MTDEEEDNSPCIGICIIDPLTEYCVGCHRSLKEIAEAGDRALEKEDYNEEE